MTEFIRTEIRTTGKVFKIEELKPIIYIFNEEYGVMVVLATDEQIKGLTVYGNYDVTMHARRKRGGDREFSDFQLISIKEKKEVESIPIEVFIAKESPKWKDVDDPVEWVRNLRGW